MPNLSGPATGGVTLTAARLDSAPEGEVPCALMSRFRSSATAARIAAVILRISAIFAAGLRSRAAPISSTNIIFAAWIASEARSIAVFMVFVHKAYGTLSRRNYQHRLSPVCAVRSAAADHPGDGATTVAFTSASRTRRTILQVGG